MPNKYIRWDDKKNDPSGKVPSSKASAGSAGETA